MLLQHTVTTPAAGPLMLKYLGKISSAKYNLDEECRTLLCSIAKQRILPEATQKAM
jgi:hypothetical protein